jgi:hypothetical protein
VCEDWGMSVPTLCANGTWSNATAATDNATCVSCGPGLWSPSGATNCSTCSPGTYSNLIGAPSCATCPVGYTCTGSAMTAPVPCDPGSISPAAGRTTSCALCSVGSYQPAPASSNCTTCPAAFYCPTTGLTAPVPCSGGFWGLVPGAVTFAEGCSMCPPGQFSYPNSTLCLVRGRRGRVEA